MASLEVTNEALGILKRSLELAGVDAVTGGVRLRLTRSLGGGSAVQIELAAAPLPGEKKIDLEGLRLFVDPALEDVMPDALVAVEPEHERVVVRPIP